MKFEIESTTSRKYIFSAETQYYLCKEVIICMEINSRANNTIIAFQTKNSNINIKHLKILTEYEMLFSERI